MVSDSLPILPAGSTLSLLGVVEKGLQLSHAKEGLASGLEKGLTQTAGSRELFSSPTCYGESTRFAGGDFQ